MDVSPFLCNVPARKAGTLQSPSANGAVLWPDVGRLRPDQHVVAVLFEDVGRPARRARRGEDGREELRLDPQGVVSRRGVKVDVGVELLLREHKLGDALGDLDPMGAPRLFVKGFG